MGIGGQPPEIVAELPEAGRAASATAFAATCRKTCELILPAEFQRMFAAHEERVVEESLCLLDVALTRAVTRPAPDHRSLEDK